MGIYFQKNSFPDFKMKILGLGGCGCNIINTLLESNLKGFEFFALNTDVNSLNKNLSSNKLHIGPSLTKGHGVGGDPEKGEKAVIESKAAIENILEGSDIVFLLAGMGGGTGTGAAPIISKIAKEKNILTMAIVTTPFDYEGVKIQEKANKGIYTLKKYVNSLVQVSNEKIIKILSDNEGSLSGFKKVDKIIFEAIKGISDIVFSDGHVNLDFQDLKSFITSSESINTLVGIGTGHGDDRVRCAINEAMKFPLLDDLDILKASGAIINISAAEEVPYSEIYSGYSYISDMLNPKANLKKGFVLDKTLGREVRVTIIANGFRETTKINNKKEGKNVEYDKSILLNNSKVYQKNNSWNDKNLSEEELLKIPAFMRRKN
jgi:cell division protein FtsZ